MNAWMVLSESATANPDGTLSILRAGISRIFGPTPPFAFRGALAVLIEVGEGDHGRHLFSIRSTPPDGQDPLPQIEGEFTAVAVPGVFSFVVGVHIAKLHEGELRFELLVDDRRMSQLTLKVDRIPRPEDG